MRRSDAKVGHPVSGACLTCSGEEVHYVGNTTTTWCAFCGTLSGERFSLSHSGSVQKYVVSPKWWRFGSVPGPKRSLREAVGLLSDLDALTKRVATFLDREVKK